MKTRGFSAYNLARGILLNPKLTVADSGNQPLRLLDIVVSGMGMDSTAGLWLTPLHGTPAVPRVFPFDLIYLDKEYRVLQTAEMGPGIDFPLFNAEAASALILPSDTLHRTKTAEGDHLIVCASDELEGLLAVSSMPAPDAAEPVPRAAAPALSSGARPEKPGTIELTPERPIASAAHATPFEQSVLTAVAKVAETRNTEPKPFTSSLDDSVPGPSMAVTEAVLDPSRAVLPAVIEHRIDPEDLFSNWVAAAPPPAKPRAARPEPHELAKVAPVPREAVPEPTKQNGRKGKSHSDTSAAPRTSSPAAKPQAGERPESEVPERSVAKPASSRNTDLSPSVQAPAAQTFPATTFTAAPYSMWQVSMPTAVAPTGAKSPPPAPRALSPSGEVGTKPVESAKSRWTARVPDKAAPAAEVPIALSSLPADESGPKAEVVAPAMQPVMSPARPAGRNASGCEAHKPGDFVASLQEKLQRVQQSRPSRASDASGAAVPLAKSVAASAPTAAPQRSPAEAPPAVPKPAPPKEASLPAFKSKAAPTPAPAKPKAEPPASGFRSKFRQWLHPTSSPSDRRRAGRRYVPGMVAHYFTGGAPRPKNVADISMSGMYLLTEDRWMPGTMIQMTLQKPCASGEKKQSINVLSRIVRRGSDGVAAEFIMPEALHHISHDIQPSQATDKFALARFL
ncbi:PilZ domain-containing protein [Occallatibacter savannae]|uniref:PilZ domain-containing protein n=1 Tax=Occallatibacter savannae TaxID=1002691 RepID=UPI000D688562|nr:PilZ domain-containing protein [Occallatibacter savannae]